MDTPTISTAHTINVTFNTLVPRCLVTNAMMDALLNSFPDAPYLLSDADLYPIVDAFGDAVANAMSDAVLK